MRHRILTCKNHPQLRWSVKDIAIGGVNPGEPALYNGSRNICFCGTPSGKDMYYDGSGLDCLTYVPGGGIIQECACPSKDLVIAPEDPMVTR